MDSEKLNDWMQVAGIFALVGSLIFVGLQMKQAQEIALSQAHFTKTDSTVQHITAGSANPYYLAAIVKINNGNGDALTPIEHEAMSEVLHAALFLFEDTFYQYRNGFVSPEQWNSTRDTLDAWMRDDSPFPARPVFEQYLHEWDRDFRQEVVEIIQKIDAESAN